ncbi:hypothetical protein Tco_0263628, partial [Tanacetum coccineum]
MMVQAQEEMGEGSANPTNNTHKTPIITQRSTSQPQKKQPRRKQRKDTEVGLSAKVISSNDEGLGDQEDASEQGRKIADIDVDVEVTLIDRTQGRNDDNLMFDISVFDEQ